MTSAAGAGGAPGVATTRAGRLQSDPDGRGALRASGDWTLPHYADLQRAVARAAEARAVDLGALGGLDTAGAALLARLLGPARLRALPPDAPGLTPERLALLRAVGEAAQAAEAPAPRRPGTLAELLARMGRAVETVWRDLVLLLGFIGLTLATLARSAARPHRWRLTPLVHQMEETGLNAVPIVVLLTFAVGAVVAYLGATVLVEFGATIYTVDLVAYAFLREFGVLITAIVIAGRTASAFTAHLGSMKANEEIDALRAQGLDPLELLVLPRVLALVLVLPMLSFIAVLAGLAGGATVAYALLDIPPTLFVTVLGDIPVEHYVVGLVKAPLFAFLIAVIGCLEGLKAGGSAQSVGMHTTSAVVQSIFVVILLDALAAALFMEVGW